MMTPNTRQEMLRWYVIETNPKQEDRAINNLVAWGVESFTPKLKHGRFNFYTGKPQYVIKPLFPRYIFARFSAQALLSKVRFTRGVQSVVSFGNEPTPVDNEIIDLVRSRIEEDGYVTIREKLNPGDPVSIDEGPLKNMKGLFERQMQDRDRVVVLLSTVSYQAHLELPKVLVKKSSAASNS